MKHMSITGNGKAQKVCGVNYPNRVSAFSTAKIILYILLWADADKPLPGYPGKAK